MLCEPHGENVSGVWLYVFINIIIMCEVGV